MTWFTEKLHANYQLRLFAEKVLYQDKTAHQDLLIFENPVFGRVLALDGVIQTTEGDEFIYHEMLAHVPILAHGRTRRVLIVGGGDGGVLRRVLEHPGVEEATLVEIDRSVIELCRTYLAKIGGAAFDAPRARVVIADGAKFVAETADRFDVIIVDSTDPIGPGEVLFSSAFYTDCKRCLAEGGIIVTQSGVPFLQKSVLANTFRRLSPLFADTSFFVAPVPTYAGGFMAFGWATDDRQARRTTAAVLAGRAAAAGLCARYYNPEIHAAAFMLPNYVRDLIA